MNKTLVMVTVIICFARSIAFSGPMEMLTDKIVDSTFMDNAIKNSGLDPSSKDAAMAKTIVKGTMGTGNSEKALRDFQNYIEKDYRTDSHQKINRSIPKKCLSAKAYFNKKKYKKAFRNYEACAREGNAFAQYHTALMYAQGLGVKQNVKAAKSWAMKAAGQGDKFADRLYEFLLLIENTEEDCLALFADIPFFVNEKAILKAEFSSFNNVIDQKIPVDVLKKYTEVNIFDGLWKDRRFLKIIEENVGKEFVARVNLGEFGAGRPQYIKDRMVMIFSPNWRMTNENKWYWFGISKQGDYDKFYGLIMEIKE